MYWEQKVVSEKQCSGFHGRRNVPALDSQRFERIKTKELTMLYDCYFENGSDGNLSMLASPTLEFR